MLISAIKEGKEYYLSDKPNARHVGYSTLERLENVELALQLVEMRRDSNAVSFLKHVKDKYAGKRQDMVGKAEKLLPQSWAIPVEYRSSTGETKEGTNSLKETAKVEEVIHQIVTAGATLVEPQSSDLIQYETFVLEVDKKRRLSTVVPGPDGQNWG